MHSTLQHPQQPPPATTVHNAAAGTNMAVSQGEQASCSRSNSTSRAASRAGALQDIPTVPSRPHSRLAQQYNSSCTAQQQDKELQHATAATATQDHSSCSSGVDEQRYMPGQSHGPSSRLGHHIDMYSFEKQQQQQQQQQVCSNSTCAGSAVAAGAGASSAPESGSRQHSSSGARVSSRYLNEAGSPCSATTPGTPNSSSWRASSSPSSVQQQQQEQQTECPARSEGLRDGTCIDATLERPGSSSGMQMQFEQQKTVVHCANPLFSTSSSAAALWGGTAAAVAATTARAASAAAGSLRDRSSPMGTPRRLAGGYAAAAGNGMCSATGAAVGGCTRPGSSNARNAGGHSISSSSSRPKAVPGSLNPLQQSGVPQSSSTAALSRPYSASKQGRPNSCMGRPGSQQQQQQHSSYDRSQALPAGVLSQDLPPAAARLGATYLRNSSSSSMSQSRPGSAAKQSPGESGAAELRCPSRQQLQSYRQRQQSAVGVTAAPAASVLAATPRNRPVSTSSRRPGSAAAKPGSRQQQQHAGEAQGPLLSEYLRPPSAAAPGSISMFGLPGMEPPGRLASVVPSVKVPSVHASWDAGVGGLLSASSSSSSGALASPEAGVALTAGAGATAALCSRMDVAGAGRSHAQQLHKQQSTRPGTTPAATAAADTNGCRVTAQSRGTLDSSQSLRRPGSAAVGRDAAGVDGAQQLLLWSAAHEMDGRPVTRDGERMRPQSRGMTVE